MSDVSNIAPAAESAPAAQQPNLSQELMNAEGTRAICANLLRFLKEASVRGSEAYQLAQSIEFIAFVHKQNDQAVKEIKRRMSKGEEADTSEQKVSA